jgi:hypothetical protein
VSPNTPSTSREIPINDLVTPTAKIFTEGFDNPGMARDDITARAKEFASMGVDAILIGSVGLSTFATYTGISKTEDPEIPVFDVISVGLKVAELRADHETRCPRRKPGPLVLRVQPQGP